MRLGLLTISLLASTVSGFAQKLDFKMVDELSYDYFLAENWEKLISLAEQANKQGIDYHYLQTRLGTAYYNIGQYRKAVKTFEKAVKTNASSAYAKEYYYYSLVLAGDAAAARLFAFKNGGSFIKKIGEPKNDWLDFINLEGGFKYSTDDPPIGHIRYLQLGVSHKFSVRFSLYHHVSTLNQPKYGQTLKQFQYFIQPRFQINETWAATAGLHLLQLSFSDSSFTNFTVAAGLRKRFGAFDINPFWAYSEVNGINVIQLGVSTMWYPLGNQNIIGITTLNPHFASDSTQTTIAFKQSLSVKVLSKLWLTGEFTYGDELLRVSGDNLSILNNSSDLNNYQYSLMATVPVNSKWSLYALFMKENKNLENTDLTYKFNSIIFGLNFRP